ncbi:MAG: hypothetical protein Q9188_004721, partial [Gyalolechia gomerana]
GLRRSGAPPQLPRIQRGLPQKRPIPSVRKAIAVSSAKGGVGKSTIAVNLALAFARAGHRTGILDTDIFGPSIPTLLALSGEPRLSEKNQLLPLSNYGVKSMSMGYLVGEDAPVVWRGLMVMKALQQLLWEVEWGGLDVLVMDLPPGTGDTQLTVTQQVVLDGGSPQLALHRRYEAKMLTKRTLRCSCGIDTTGRFVKGRSERGGDDEKGQRSCKFIFSSFPSSD